MRRGVLAPAIAALALLAQVMPALAFGDAAAGKAIAEGWCASCHLVSPEQQTATTEAPPFETIAERTPDEIAALAAFLADPHPPMPNLSLTRQEIRDLLAYISSLN